MTSPFTPSTTVHKIVEYVKLKGFDYEAHELLDMDLGLVLSKEYGVRELLTQKNLEQIKEDLYLLAEANEIREAIRKDRELQPEDSGVMIFRQPARRYGERATCYTMPYTYPVDEVLREVRINKPRGARFPKRKRAPAKTGLTEDGK